ncbi:uncharacterized protein MAM_07870 [Metarhizium album ARSEF 1941]|uniref:Uncharacterized protein n=1 Tax=Metarhizium album (strain ARSEF 1941) TaxID=1081103 RepID=A0A0B2WKS2_METAS|nr:uncharacterized protein MAM_07870 [Metarhizium album ARSEF 1941]KHN94234.1 hypothetical protein MAM_07870 [Metarhizium album ARSEF 1941]
MKYFADGPAWLNDTIAFAGCYAAAQTTDGAGHSKGPEANARAAPAVSTPKSTEMPPRVTVINAMY